MHEPGIVGGGEAPGGLDHDLHDGLDGLTPAPLGGGVQAVQPGAKALAFDQLHGHEDLIAAVQIDHAHVVDLDDVLVLDLGDRPGLALQPRAGPVGAAPRGFAGMQQLERDAAIELGVVGGKNGAHTPRAQRAEHLIATDDLGAFDATLVAQRVELMVDQRALRRVSGEAA